MILPIRLFRVRGESMLPTFPPNTILVGAARYIIKPKPGMPVVFRLHKKLYIKRLKKISEQGYWLEGDNSANSTDSRIFGAVEGKDIMATIVFRVR